MIGFQIILPDIDRYILNLYFRLCSDQLASAESNVRSYPVTKLILSHKKNYKDKQIDYIACDIPKLVNFADNDAYMQIFQFDSVCCYSQIYRKDAISQDSEYIFRFDSVRCLEHIFSNLRIDDVIDEVYAFQIMLAKDMIKYPAIKIFRQFLLPGLSSWFIDCPGILVKIIKHKNLDIIFSIIDYCLPITIDGYIHILDMDLRDQQVIFDRILSTNPKPLLSDRGVMYLMSELSPTILEKLLLHDQCELESQNMHYACSNGLVNCVQSLLDRGCELDNTCLIIAVENCSVEIVRLLLDYRYYKFDTSRILQAPSSEVLKMIIKYRLSG